MTLTSNPPVPTPTTSRADVRPPMAPVVPARSALAPLGVDEVTVTEGFWHQRRTVNRDATLPHIADWLEREGWLPNFDLAAEGRLPDGRRGREFADSEVYKFLEALAWDLGSQDRPENEELFCSVVARVAAAQEPDGYLNTNFGRPGQAARWSDMEWGHELYCLGHLFQAAIARARTLPGSKDGLLAIACRAADLVCDTFGEAGRSAICGHPEIEVGLAELARVTGEPRYRQQAKLFVDRRGHQTLAEIEWGRSYYQDDIPIREADVARGHAVRANYLAAGAVDVAVDTEDNELLDALQHQWRQTVARRTYLTGGQGAHHQDEAFGADWELPPDRAYSETCAGIGSIMLSWRLLLATGEESYADLVERTLFNVVATSPARDGRSFYYSNTLHQRSLSESADPDTASLRANGSMRAAWFHVSCCPPNVARTLASLSGYIASKDEDGLQIHQYAPSQISTTLPDGEAVEVRIETRYPDDGDVTVTVLHDATRIWGLRLRVPAWAEDAALRVTSDGAVVDERTVSPGSVEVRRRFRTGDAVQLHLPMNPRTTHPDPRIDAVRGCVAFERGPVVLCLESADLPEGVPPVSINAARLASEQATERGDRVWVELTVDEAPDAPWPYQPVAPDTRSAPLNVPLVPYHDWANRGRSTMRIWIPST